jgi:leucyl-tRNA synthetase
MDFKNIESKWQKKWEENKIFEVGLDKSKKKFYCLAMFPYPSGEGLHMGHALNYFIEDIFARFKRMNGFNVLHPVGYDSFGLPAENAAIKVGEHPREYTNRAINNYIRQQKKLGLSYDWSKMLSSCEPEYYKWNQYFFLKFLENGLVSRRKSPVNWCAKCESVLANEQVHNGKCWRHEDTDVKIRQLEQWFIKTTAYADELLEKVDDLEWPEKIKLMQKNWIGKSYGTEVFFEVKSLNATEKWSVFTTRPDTIYGVMFMVVSAQHPKLMELVSREQKSEVEGFLEKLGSVSEKNMVDLEKEGVFTGSYAINPMTKEKIPIYVGNFVLADYGSGMVMAVPAHDERDFDFAKKYDLPIKQVIEPDFTKKKEIKGLKESVKNLEVCYSGEGKLVNSGEFNGMDNQKAIHEITKLLESEGLGKKSVQYKFKDWLISRQRYWGTPIPIIYCKKCGVVPVPLSQLPVLLPEKAEFGKGNPLNSNKEFVNVKCPKCNEDAKRETDTMDTFFDSSWYFLRFCDSQNNEKPFEKEKIKYWMPVDQYVGGAEHACMHLIYARFFVKALRDLDFFIEKINEPFVRLFNQGMLHAADGTKMSKSKGNVVLPEEISGKYGIDTARLFLMSVASPDKDIDWSEKGVEGSLRFLNKVINYFGNVKIGSTNGRMESRLNRAIKEVTEDIENFRYNLAVIKIRDLFNHFPEEIGKNVLEKFLKLLSPFCPHISEELWEKLGNKGFISLAEWPKVDKGKLDPDMEKQEQAIGKLIEDINHVLRIIKEKEGKEYKKVFIYVVPNEKGNLCEEVELIEKRTGVNVEIFAVNEEGKYDPENKSKKVKPGRPGIYLE